MCTLVVFSGVSKRHPLVIAANRDEVPSRPSRGPRLMSDIIFAPQDLLRGGTWTGFNRHGVAVAITNRVLGGSRKGCRSRGMLVMDCLGASSREKAVTLATRSSPADYNGFHLLVADKDGATLIVNDGMTVARKDLAPGLHVITSYGTEPGHSARDRRIREIARPELADDPDALGRLLSFHGPGPEDGTCAHGEGVTMESIFSMVAQLPVDVAEWRLRWRIGRPCADHPWNVGRTFLNI